MKRQHQQKKKRKLDFNLICRLCLRQRCALLPIFLDSTLSTRIMVFAPTLQVALQDGLPANICEECVWMTNMSYKFKLQCESANKALLEQQKGQDSESYYNKLQKILRTEDVRRLTEQVTVQTADTAVASCSSAVGASGDTVRMENDTTINASIMSDTTIDIDTVMSELTEDHAKETARVDEGRFSPSSNLQASASEETMPNSSIKMSTSELEHESNIYKNAQKSTNSIPSNMLDPTLTVLPSDREEGLIGHNGGIETTPGKIHVAAKISLSEMRNSDVMRRTVNEHTYSVQDVQSINDRKQKYISNPRKNDITLQQTKRVNVLKASSSNGEVCLHEQNISVRTTPDQVHLPWQFNEASALDNDESENCDVFKRRTFGEFGPLLELFNGHRYCSGKEIHTTENEASDSEMQESSLILGENDAPSPQTKQNRRKVLTSSNRENGVLNGHSRSAETIPGKEHIAFQMCVQGMLGNNSAVKIENSNIKRDQVANNRKQNERAIEVVDISSDSSSDCEYIDLASESSSDSESETEQTVTKTRHLKKKKNFI